MNEENKAGNRWGKLLAVAGISVGATLGGQRLAVDSPVHFGVVGQSPAQADGWDCKPEGGIIGAPMVCRPKAETIQASVEATSAAADTFVGTGHPAR